MDLALEGRPNRRAIIPALVAISVSANLCRISRFVRLQIEMPISAALSGRIWVAPQPGLKAWAILSLPFGRKNGQTLAPGLKPWAILSSPFGRKNVQTSSSFGAKK